MTQRNLHVVVLTPLGSGGKGGVDRLMDQLRPYTAQMVRRGIDVKYIVTRGPLPIAFSPIFFAWALTRLICLHLIWKIDLAHINLSSKGSTYRKLIAARLLRWLGVPYIVHLHCGGFPDFWSNSSRWLSRAITTLFSRSSRIIVLGRVYAEMFRARMPYIEWRVIVLPNATARPRLIGKSKQDAAQVNILFLGQLGIRKGVPTLLAALNRLRYLSGWHAILAGDGEVSETRAHVVALDLAARIEVLGWLADAEAGRMLQAADILVLPSLVENMPMAIIEGFAHGLAVVATPVGAVPDVVQNDLTGLLVEPGNEQELEQALMRLILDPDLRLTLGANARAKHEQSFEIGKYVERLESLWLSLGRPERRTPPSH